MTVPATTPATLEQAAVELASRGYYIFPCRPRSKEPLTSNGFKNATRDERQILHWWDQHPLANIGIACGATGLIVLDIDSKHGANPSHILNGDRPLHGAPIILTGTAAPADPQHPASLPGVRGAQVYFHGTTKTTKLPLDGCEIKADGGYVIAPPSVHPSGATYGPSLPPHVSELPPPPEWLEQLISDQASHYTGPAAPVDDAIIAGGRNDQLASIAGTLRRRGLDADEIEASLLVTNAKRCRPPLDPAEVRQIAQSIARYKPAHPVNGNGAAPKFKPLAADAKAAARALTQLLDLDSVGMHITGARLYGKGSSASIEIDASNKETLTFGALREMMRPQSLIAEVAACTGAAPTLKQIDCARALTLARQVAELVEVDSENDIAREWGRDFLDIAEVLDIDMTNQAERWRAFDHLSNRDPWGRGHDPHEPPAPPLVLRGLDGMRYVRTLWFERYVKTRDSSVSRTAIGPRMARVGWQRRGKQGDIKATAPGRPEHRIWPFWLVAQGWEGFEEAAA